MGYATRVPAARPDKQRFDVSLEDLQTFLAVADLGSFSRAAEQLSLSQPSVSNRIRRLEEKLSCQLLRRTTRRIDLTTDGARLHTQAAPMLTALKRLLRDFDIEATARRTEVNVVTTAMVATVALPPLVKAFGDLHPAISVRLHDRLPAGALRAVTDGACDFAIMATEALPPEVRSELLTTDTCVVVTPLAHSLCSIGAATLAEVLQHELLVPAGYVVLRDAIDNAASQHGLTARYAAQAQGVTNTMTLLAMTAAGLGIGIHPGSLIPSELLPTIGVIRLADCAVTREFRIVVATGAELSPAASTLLAYLRSVVSTDDGWPR